MRQSLVKTDEKTMSLPTFIALVALLSTGVGAWVDVKSDIAVNTTNSVSQEKQLDKIDEKLDKIYDHLLKQNNTNSEDSSDD